MPNIPKLQQKRGKIISVHRINFMREEIARNVSVNPPGRVLIELMHVLENGGLICLSDMPLGPVAFSERENASM